jgi:YbgC/YbaW family acyl-CoA thioester hydrolase
MVERPGQPGRFRFGRPAFMGSAIYWKCLEAGCLPRNISCYCLADQDEVCEQQVGELPGAPMSSTSENLIAWGDCDGAGIIYYPKYFYFMDVAFQALLRKAGFNHHIIYEQFGARTPIVQADAKFIAPASFEDRLAVDAKIVHWGTKSFRVSYQGARDGAPIFEGSEARVWATVAPDGSITTVAIPLAFKDALSAIANG